MKRERCSVLFASTPLHGSSDSVELVFVRFPRVSRTIVAGAEIFFIETAEE